MDNDVNDVDDGDVDDVDDDGEGEDDYGDGENLASDVPCFLIDWNLHFFKVEVVNLITVRRS